MQGWTTDSWTTDNWTNGQLSQNFTLNWTKRQLNQRTTEPKDNWTKGQLSKSSLGSSQGTVEPCFLSWCSRQPSPERSLSLSVSLAYWLTLVLSLWATYLYLSFGLLWMSASTITIWDTRKSDLHNLLPLVPPSDSLPLHHHGSSMSVGHSME